MALWFVIASAAKQSRVIARNALDCFVAALLAMTKVGKGSFNYA